MKSQIEKGLLREIMNKEGLIDWKLFILNDEKKAGGVCIYSCKEIWLGKNHLNIPFLLHEISHALLPGGLKKGHNVEWSDKYTKLVEKYWSKTNEKGN